MKDKKPVQKPEQMKSEAEMRRMAIMKRMEKQC